MSERYAGQEMRKCPRSEAKMPFTYQTPRSLGSRTSFTKNISRGGLCFETEMPVSRGDILRIEADEPVAVRLRRGAPVLVSARVVWVKELVDDKRYESGLEFVN